MKFPVKTALVQAQDSAAARGDIEVKQAVNAIATKSEGLDAIYALIVNGDLSRLKPMTLAILYNLREHQEM